MARPRGIPAYRHHKPRNCAVVRIDGRDHYLGPYGSPESHEKYARLIAERCSSPSTTAVGPASSVRVRQPLSIVELVAKYWLFARKHYCRDGRPTSHCNTIRASLRPLVKLYGSTAANEFSPRSLKAVRDYMIEQGLSRSYINGCISTIRKAFAWAVEEELVDVTVHQALLRVRGLKKGRSAARETQAVGLVTEATVEATLPHLSPVVADLVRIQRLLGCRPGEACDLRPCDLDTSGEVWVYIPASHKTEHHGKQRQIFIGPRAQAILRPYLDDRDPTSYCFSPAEAVQLRQAERRAKRKSPVQPSQVSRKKSKPARRPGDRYTKDSYNTAICRACDEANAAAHAANPAIPAETRLVPRWHPNQLRHTAGTEIRQRFGLEAAQVVLGHSRADVTQVYAERDQSKAAAVMLELG